MILHCMKRENINLKDNICVQETPQTIEQNKIQERNADKLIVCIPFLQYGLVTI